VTKHRGKCSVARRSGRGARHHPGRIGTAANGRLWPTSADLRGAPKSSAILRYCRRAGRTAAIAVVDPELTFGQIEIPRSNGFQPGAALACMNRAGPGLPSWMSVTMTVAPSSGIRSAASPMPDAPPVTMATCPLSSPLMPQPKKTPPVHLDRKGFVVQVVLESERRAHPENK
jgi:hypothetical protein